MTYTDTTRYRVHPLDAEMRIAREGEPASVHRDEADAFSAAGIHAFGAAVEDTADTRWDFGAGWESTRNAARQAAIAEFGSVSR